MSAIYFQSKAREVEVRGTERHYAGKLINGITELCLDIDNNRELLLKGVPAFHGIREIDINHPSWSDIFRAALFGGELELEAYGSSFDSFHLALNTASALGSDAIKMLARIHGQCEIHGFFSVENRDLCAKIIEKAPKEVFRANAGWDDVVELLRESEDGPVVMSYSTTGSFLSTVRKDWEARGDESRPWDSLTDDQQWNNGVAWLRNHSDRGINPKSIAIPYGYSRATAITVLDELRALQDTSGIA